MKKYPKPPLTKDTLWGTFRMQSRMMFGLLFLGFVVTYMVFFAIEAPIVFFGTILAMIGILSLGIVGFIYYSTKINPTLIQSIGTWALEKSIVELEERAQRVEEIGREIQRWAVETQKKEGLSGDGPIPDKYLIEASMFAEKFNAAVKEYWEQRDKTDELMGNLKEFETNPMLLQQRSPKPLGEFKTFGDTKVLAL